MPIRGNRSLPITFQGRKQLSAELDVSLGREAEILEDLHWARLQHGPDTEPWNALLKELGEQERRTRELGRQLSIILERRQEINAIVVDRLLERREGLHG